VGNKSSPLEDMVIMSNLSKSFWLNKKILITGNTGFKGSWLTIWLHLMGAKVYGYSLCPEQQTSMWNICNVESLCTQMKYADICDYSILENYILEVKPDIIIHMAAQAIVQNAYQSPYKTYETNIMGTVNLLEVVRLYKIPCSVINITTDKCYDNKEWIWSYRENEALGGTDPYSSSKACSELVTRAYYKSYFEKEQLINLASARAGNVIGGGDWSEYRLIPDIINSIYNNQDIVIRNPKSVRPWQHVLDALSGYLTLVEHLYIHGSNFNDAWNFGPSKGVNKTVESIAEKMVNMSGCSVPIIKQESRSDMYKEACLLSLDSTKSNVLLNWYPVLDIEDTLYKVVDWYQAYFSKENMLDFTIKQIQEYILLRKGTR